MAASASVDWGDSIPHRPKELSYIRTVPIPIREPPRSATVRTRCISGRSTILEYTQPSRQQVRESNYERRNEQKTRQGFVSLKQKPYRPIGDPVYLNTKHLISDALGLAYQVDDDLVEERPLTPTLSELQAHSKEYGRVSAQALLSRRSRRKLNTLKKELDGGRSLLRNVQLGHGLFKVLQDEWTKTVARKKAEATMEKQRAIMDWRAATADNDDSSSESESGDDQDRHDNLAKYFIQLDVPDYARQQEPELLDNEVEEGVRFSIRPETHAGFSTDPDRTKEARLQLKSAPPTRPARHRGHPPRPYTPVHNNISFQRKQVKQVVGETLFKQLCCLHWILKTMDIPEMSITSPLISCWQLNGDLMGGMELNRRAVEEKKQNIEGKYSKLMKNEQEDQEKTEAKSKPEKKKSNAFTYPRNIRSRSGSIAQSSTSNEPPATSGVDNLNTSLDEHRAELESLQEDKSEESNPPHSQETGTPRAGAPESIPKTPSRKRSQSNRAHSLPAQQRADKSGLDDSPIQLTLEELRQQELARQLEEVAKMDSQPMERLSHTRAYRATDKLKSKSSKELIEFRASCKSSQLQHRPKELKQSWSDIKEERALRLHDQLDYHDKYRMQTCRNKFSAMSSTSNSVHRALKDMRLKNEFKRREDEKERNKKQDRSKYAQWFEDLNNMIPEDCTNQWYIRGILDKLRIYGIKYGPDNKTESSSKASESKFTRVLTLIRPWEICSPDVAAAVEFCRDRIIEMNEEEFEVIFQHIFPSIDRPTTASAKTPSTAQHSAKH